jgi:hypothetical protein
LRPSHSVRGYDTFGRMKSVTSGTGSGGYGHMANSDLLQTTSCSNSGSAVMTTTRAWEFGFRLRSIANTVNGGVFTGHNYYYDNVNRRIQCRDPGVTHFLNWLTARGILAWLLGQWRKAKRSPLIDQAILKI